MTAARPRALPPAARELATVLALFAAYNLGRLLATTRVGPADEHARAIRDLQAGVALPDEADLQAWALGVEGLVALADRYYLLHFPVTAAVLVWLWVRHRPSYRWARTALALATGVAMLVHLVLPVTPPRLLAEAGMVDTGQHGGTSVYAGSPLAGLANEYAAVPSLHVGWALLLAVVLVATLRSRWRWLWLLHPALTTATVVVTANHWWLDAAAGALLVGAALLLAAPRAPTRRTTSADSAHHRRRLGEISGVGTGGEEAGGATQVGAHGVRREAGEHRGERAGGAGRVQRERRLDLAAARRRGELEGEHGREGAPGAALGPAVRAVQLGGLHPRAQPGAGDVDPGLTGPGLPVDVLDAGEAGLPGRPVARVDQVVEGDLGSDRHVHAARTSRR
nr:phosphatase PAP2 family protein [Nocardioides sp. zg-DK7169]